MKKLTAGIFSVLMGLVSVNAAEAAVASKAYVDTKIGDTGDKTVVELISSVGGDATALAGRVTTAESEITILKGDETKEGSVAKKIADAIGGLSAASVGAEGSFISTVSQADGTITAGVTPFVAEINATTNTSTIAPQTKAVATYIDGKITQIDSDLTAQLQPITQGVTDLGGRVDALETDNTTNKADIDALQETVAKLDGNGEGSIAKQIETVTAEVTRVETEYKAADTALGNRVGALETDNTTNKADITAIKTEQATQNSDIGTLKETVAKLDGNGEGSIAKQIETVTAEVTRVETEYKAADDELTQAIADGDTATLDAAKSYADQAEADAIETAGTNADAKITKLNLAALSRVPVDCQDPDSFCVLTAKGGMFYWEAIERATGEEQPAGAAIPPVTQ